jgi:hypothetical protein
VNGAVKPQRASGSPVFVVTTPEHLIGFCIRLVVDAFCRCKIPKEKRAMRYNGAPLLIFFLEEFYV